MAKSKKSAPTPSFPDDDWEWKVRNATDKLIEAEQVRQDPKLLKAAEAELAKRRKAIESAAKRTFGKKLMT